MQYRLLGPLEVRDGDRLLPLGGAKQRMVLALLLVNANRVVSRERLIDELWSDRPPQTAVQSVQVYVSRLRKLLPHGTLLTRPPGYLLEIAADELDLHRFERLVGDARQALAQTDPERASAVLREALSLWGGSPLAEFAPAPFAQTEIGRLEDLHLAAEEDRIDADLAVGRHADLIGELIALIAEHPYRERLRGQLMLALYRSDRQAEALAAYQDARHALVDELGVEPSAPLQRLEKQILTHDRELDSPRARRESPGGTVTLLFTDIEGSTRLLRRAGEAYADLLAVHRRLLRTVFERYGGFEVDATGDGFFVVFTSATGAVRAAEEAQLTLARQEWPREIEIRVRIGVHTGEPRPVEGRYVGVDVHRAARVMGAAHGGQVLVTESTRALLEDPSRLRDLGDHRLKDISGPERLYQLQIEGLRVDFPPLNTLDSRPTNLPPQPNAFIGRSREIADAKALLSQDGVRHVTMTGPGGTGKTRLALQVAADLIEVFANGVFFFPFAPLRDAGLVIPTIAETLGLRERAGGPVDETLTEYLRDKQMLLLLDNFEHVISAAPAIANLLVAAPRLKILATSRRPLNLSGETVFTVPPLVLPDLAQPSDAATLGRSESVSLFVERARAAVPDFRLDDENTRALAEICVRLDGLPLAIELAAPRVRTLSPAALLVRLDQPLKLLTSGALDLDERQRTLRATIDWSYGLLPPAEQALFVRLGVFVGGCRLEAADALSEPTESGADILDQLDTLFENSLLRQRADVDGEPRFWMLETIREFALEQLSARGGADDARRRHALHYLALAEQVNDDSRTGDQSALFARLDAENANLRAAIAWSRTTGDLDAMLRFATALWSYWATRGHVTEGISALEYALGRSPERPARALLGLCALQLLSGTSDELPPVAREALAACEQLGDEYSLAQAWNLLGRVEGTLLGAMSSAEQSWRKALSYAERNNYRAERAESASWLMVSAIFGPLPADKGIALCEHFYETAGDDPAMRAFCRVERAVLEAMRGRFTLARELLAEGRCAVEELGLSVWAAVNAQEAYFVEMLAGDPKAAARALRESHATLEQMGERLFLSTNAGFLAHALCAQGAYVEAEHFSKACEEASDRDDVHAQALWRMSRARICAHRGELRAAETLAREAVELARGTDLLNAHADALFDLGEVLAIADRLAEARAVIENSARLYEQKGNLAALEKARRRARELEEGRRPSLR